MLVRPVGRFKLQEQKTIIHQQRLHSQRVKSSYFCWLGAFSAWIMTSKSVWNKQIFSPMCRYVRLLPWYNCDRRTIALHRRASDTNAIAGQHHLTASHTLPPLQWLPSTGQTRTFFGELGHQFYIVVIWFGSTFIKAPEMIWSKLSRFHWEPDLPSSLWLCINNHIQCRFYYDASKLR